MPLPLRIQKINLTPEFTWQKNDKIYNLAFEKETLAHRMEIFHLLI